MIELILIAVVIVILIDRSRSKKRFRRLDIVIDKVRDAVSDVDTRISTLESHVSEFRLDGSDVAKDSGEVELGESIPIAAPVAKATPGPKVRKAPEEFEAPKSPPKIEPAPPPREPLHEAAPIRATTVRQRLPAWPSSWDKMASRFLENWTGILGTVVLVAGIGFIGTYAAVRLPEPARFAMVLAASAGLFAGYVLLRQREHWDKMALWLRSAAAAVFLFACAGAGALPNAGLSFIDDANIALLVLLAGVGLNVGLAWSVRLQAFASLHVVLALIPMVILPQDSITLGIVTAVAASGVYLAHRHDWPRHLLLSMLAYAAWHFWWVAKQPLGLPLPANLAGMATGSAALVFLLGITTHYRRVYADATVNKEWLLPHLASWGLLITALVVHLLRFEAFGGAALSSALLASALVAFGLSVYARKLEIGWLRTADVLIAQGLVLWSLFTWRSEFGEPVLFAAIVFLESLLFLRLVINDTSRLTATAGIYIFHAAALFFVIAGIGSLGGLNTSGAWQHAALMFAGSCVAILAGAYICKHHKTRVIELIGPEALAAIGLWAGVMSIVALFALIAQPALGMAALLMGAVLYFGALRIRDLGLIYGAWLILITAHAQIWLACFDSYAGMPMMQLAQLVPISVLVVIAMWPMVEDDQQGRLRRVAVYLLGANAGIAAFLLLAPVSSLVPTVAWLMLSLVALEVAQRLQRMEATAVLHVGYGYVVAAAAGFAMVVLPTLTYVGFLNVRVGIEVFGMAALMYWWLARPAEPLANSTSWRNVHPYFLELTLALITKAVFAEVPLVWRPMAWVLIALLFLTPQMRGLASRLAFYSLAAFVTSVIAVTANVSIAAVPSPDWYNQPENTGLLAIAVQLVYVFVAYPRLDLKGARFQGGLNGLGSLSQRLGGVNRPATICYPFFIGLALFLFWRFEQVLLTFLWSAETFAIFVLSIVLRQNHFRFVALAGLAVCVLRLIVYDLREADLFIRGLVFIGVGVVMLGMNAVYNKFGARVSET